MTEMALCCAVSYYWDSMDNSRTQPKKYWSENETVREAWRSYMYMCSLVTKVFLECPIRHLWLLEGQEVFLSGTWSESHTVYVHTSCKLFA